MSLSLPFLVSFRFACAISFFLRFFNRDTVISLHRPGFIHPLYIPLVSLLYVPECGNMPPRLWRAANEKLFARSSRFWREKYLDNYEETTSVSPCVSVFTDTKKKRIKQRLWNFWLKFRGSILFSAGSALPVFSDSSQIVELAKAATFEYDFSGNTRLIVDVRCWVCFSRSAFYNTSVGEMLKWYDWWLKIYIWWYKCDWTAQILTLSSMNIIWLICYVERHLVVTSVN